MKNRSPILLASFFILSIANLLAVGLSVEGLNYCTKPLLMPFLAAWFFLETRLKRSTFSILIIVGLCFSTFGDTLLMFAKSAGANYFLLGLGSFLLAHLAYIGAFVKYPGVGEGRVGKKPWLVLPFLAFLVGFCSFLWSDLPADFKIPVAAYAVVITTMAAFCLNMSGRVEDGAAKILMWGAIFFVLSDSWIAVAKFKFTELNDSLSGISIMATYLAGQFFIAKGSSKANDSIQMVPRL
ncbi:MAG: lysoplasmalogenase [Bacteroidetes bacterium]|nr:lysoplasmalogenase [Bacteroidota bacterium]